MTDTEMLALKETIATDVRLPKELAVRLKGSTPEEIKKDAYELKRMLGINTAPPLAGYDPPHAYDNIKEVQLHNAYRDTLKQLHVMDDWAMAMTTKDYWDVIDHILECAGGRDLTDTEQYEIKKQICMANKLPVKNMPAS